MKDRISNILSRITLDYVRRAVYFFTITVLLLTFHAYGIRIGIGLILITSIYYISLFSTGIMFVISKAFNRKFTKVGILFYSHIILRHVNHVFDNNIVKIDETDENSDGYITKIYYQVKDKYRDLLDRGTFNTITEDIGHVNFSAAEYIDIKEFPVLTGIKPFIYYDLDEEINLNYKTLKKYENAVNDPHSLPHMINTDIWFISSKGKHKNKTFAYLTADNKIIHIPVDNVKHVLIPKNNRAMIVKFRVASEIYPNIYDDIAVVTIPAITANKLSKKSTYNICASYGDVTFRQWHLNKLINNVKLVN